MTLHYDTMEDVAHIKSTEIRVGTEMIDQWKIIISRLTAEHAGQPAKDGKYRVLSTMEL